MNDIVKRARPGILALKPYKSARSMVQGKPGLIYLDANECPYAPMAGALGYNRYPDQQPADMVDALCRLYNVSSRNLLVTRGADEAIELVVRAFCVPGQDNVIICPPTFPMYAHSAHIQGADVCEVALDQDFQLDVESIRTAADENTKIVFVCSPNNPTGNLMRTEDIEDLLVHFDGKAVVAVDETYNCFSGAPSFAEKIEKYPNLLVFRTLSKEYACAGLRSGVGIARHDLLEVMRRVLPPYPVPVPVAQAAVRVLNPANVQRLQGRQKELLESRARFVRALKEIEVVTHIYPTDANYVMVRVTDSRALHEKCLQQGIIVRDQSYQANLENCVRISIGTDEEMDKLLAVMKGEPLPVPAKQRTASVQRTTKETAIDVTVNLDAETPIKISTGIGFYDHMLDQLARHGGFSLVLNCEGDLHIDPHHTVEDCAIALGQALKEAIGDKAGINRFGFTAPLDEALAQVVLDLSGRAHLEYEADFADSMVGNLPVDMVEHVFRSLCENMKATCHISAKGENTHHMVEAIFKSFARALRQAIKADGTELPSTKGML